MCALSTPGLTAAERLAELIRAITGVCPPVRIRAWDGTEAGRLDGPVLIIRTRRALRRLFWAPGELGLARAYVSGEIDVDGDLADGLRRVWHQARAGRGRVRLTAPDLARAALVALRLGAFGPPPRPPVSEARLRGPLHTRRRDRAAIAHHYDLSNAFYRLLLDDHMAYSSAYFTHDRQTLHEAQTAKLDVICRKLGLEPGMRLLDVGCGWGSLIMHAAEAYGVTAVGITLSEQQRDFVVKRIAERGLGDKVQVRMQDYRELGAAPQIDGARFDAVASIEMGEHVGTTQYPRFMRILHAALEPKGRMLLQQMSRRADAAPGGGAFIESYIAPDMHMRPLAQTIGHVQDAGFEVRDVEAMREQYVRTVQAWIRTFDDHYPEFVASQGEEVARVWRLYLTGGALAFAEGRMGVDQILAVKPDNDGTAGMPLARPWAISPQPRRSACPSLRRHR